ncbi:MAG TPA: outer membrane beta-barrel protein [Methylomusa anaerophila]|uniref:Outer membrane protein beta-barrel domain-containing protein n=1 Tax=Methylomusa anaerophila TaxID=1930071 RepID=A0A348AJ51_9FIRM|nr:outer membrane beta-barrel protein [Methylomusa anaerophila]BBB91099.1 hypothetical protein MAMMFC1_01767 [Methylomusa anaerophila]HML88976.1 outer membrane beta-barrel protein [Methylomusa anaerophila]
MKKVLVALTGLMLFSSTALASPLTDYSQGKASVDLTWRNTENSISDVTIAFPPYDKKYNLDAGITLGLGNNFAVQYRNFEPESASTGFVWFGVTYPDTAKFTFNEYNLLYKLDKNISVFTGLVTAKGKNVYAGSSDTKNFWQFGVVGSAPIADKTTLWGSMGTGADLFNWEAGVSYEFSPGWEFNVNYRTIQSKKLHWPPYPTDLNAEGLGFGVTYKFK